MTDTIKTRSTTKWSTGKTVPTIQLRNVRNGQTIRVPMLAPIVDAKRALGYIIDTDTPMRPPALDIAARNDWGRPNDWERNTPRVMPPNTRRRG